MSSSRAGGGDDEVDGAEGNGGRERARRSALDARNVVVNLRALAITSVAVDTCKLALATVTTVRRQPNRGFVFLASIAVWSLSAKLAVIVASLAAYGLVFWAASREARRPMLAAAAVFAVAIVMRFLFMIEGAVVVLQESATHTHANDSSALDAPHLHASADHGVLTKSGTWVNFLKGHCVETGRGEEGKGAIACTSFTYPISRSDTATAGK